MYKPGRGRFFVLDGIDGCGKSTQAQRLVRALAARVSPARPGTPGGGAALVAEQARDPAVLHLREPGSTAAGERIRALLLDPEPALTPAAQTLLFASARAQMLEECVAPALAAGRDVVCERFHASTFAYQGVALGLGEEQVLALLLAWANEPAPTLTLILDLAPEAARARRGSRDRFEARDPEFHRRVAEGYRRYAARVPRTVLVDATGTPDEVEARIRAEVERAAR